MMRELLEGESGVATESLAPVITSNGFKRACKLMHTHCPAIRVDECERCGTTAELHLHHWAPSAAFEDADEWPVSWLCRPCHVRWHRIMAVRKAHG